MNPVISLRRLARLARYARQMHLWRLVWAVETVEVSLGHFLSSQLEMAADRDGRPIPWFTYPAVAYLSSLDWTGKHVFEYGSGNSTLFWAARAASVTSVEHDVAWYEKMLEAQQANQRLLLRQDADCYVNCPLEDRRAYDVIVVDGIRREGCAIVATKCLAPGGLVVLDDTDRYPEAAQTLREADLIEVDFAGLAPILYRPSVTSLFLRRDMHIKQCGAPAAGVDLDTVGCAAPGWAERSAG